MRQVLGPHGIPYRIKFMGTMIRVRWGDPSGELLERPPRRDYMDYGYYCEAEKTIYLAVFLRKKKWRILAWETLSHELQGHAVNHIMRGITLTDGDGRRRKWRPMSHERIHLNEIPLASLMLENPGVFSPCLPPPSSARRSSTRNSPSPG